MEDQTHNPNSPNHGSERSEPVRSRWSPKPEQILILESIFNSGMVNPPKEETVRIRKLLEKFGPVGDANVFYWFQNRRSRSRRRQRQIQAANISAGEQPPTIQLPTAGGASIPHLSFPPSPPLQHNLYPTLPSSSNSIAGSSSASCVGAGDPSGDVFTFSGQMGVPEIEQNSPTSLSLCSSDTGSLHYQAGFITVFINGVVTEVPRAPLDMKAMFGQDSILIHSSGNPVPFDDYGFSLHSLQHGESYFLVPRAA